MLPDNNLPGGKALLIGYIVTLHSAHPLYS